MSITLIIIIATCVVSLTIDNRPGLKQRLMMNPYAVKNYREYYRMVTHAFLHSSLMHLLINMFVLYQFGGEVEKYFSDNYHPSLYLFFYLAATVFATFPSLYKHGNNSYYNSLGASGAVAAVLFAYIILFPTHGLMLMILPFFELPAIVFGVLYFVYEGYMNKRGSTGIAHDAHIFGAIFGIGAMVALDIDNLFLFFNQIAYYVTNFSR